MTCGRSTSDHTADPESPASAEWASAPKVTIDVAVALLAGVLLLQGVPEEGAVQVYERSLTAGPSDPKAVTWTVMEPVPEPCVVRIL